LFCNRSITQDRLRTAVIPRGSPNTVRTSSGHGARAEFREHRDRGWHEGWRHHRHADKVVIVKHRRHEY
jgi:hypothetical protein